MEPLSGAASVISVVSLAIQICEELKKLHDFWQSVKEAPDDISSISTELKLFMTWLTVIANNYQRQGSNDKNPNEAAATDTLKLCLTTVHNMSAGVRDIESEIAKGSLSRRWASVKFVFRKEKREKAMAQIERMKSLLIIVQTCHLAEVQEAGFRILCLNLKSGDSALYNTQSLVTLNTSPVNEHSAIETRPPSSSSTSVELVSSYPTLSSQAACRTKHRTTQQSERAYNFGLAMLRLVSTEQESIFLEESGNERRIPARRIRYDFRIAQWLLSRGFSWQSSGTYGSWKHNFRTFHYVPQDSLIVDFCKEGDVANVQKMFEKGLASPFDRVCYESEDWSLLHFSIANGHAQLCKFLIEAGLGRGGASGMSWDPILSLASRSLTSNPAAHIDILRLMIQEGQYDPMEDGIYGSVMHDFNGLFTVFKWLLDQEEFCIDLNQSHPIMGNIARSLMRSGEMDSSKCLEAVICRGDDSCGWLLDDGISLAHVAAYCTTFLINNPDFPRRIKALRDASFDFHTRKTNSPSGTPFDALLVNALCQVLQAKSSYDRECNKPREESKSLPKPPTGSTRRVVDYDILDPDMNIKCRPRISKALWQTWNTKGNLTWVAVSGLSLLEISQRYLDAWMEVLLEAGLDIAEYGRREDQLHPEGIIDNCYGEGRVVFEYGSHVNGCRIHVTEIWLYDPDDDEETDEEEWSDDEEATTPAEPSKMPCSWDYDNE